MVRTLTRRIVVVVAVAICLTALIASLSAYWVLYTHPTPAALQWTMLLLLFSAGAAALIGAVLTGLYVRRLVVPLGRLTKAAKRLSYGDLGTPIPTHAPTQDIVALATTLEQSRVNLARTLAELDAARHWSQALIASINEGIVTYDATGRIRFFSEGAARMTGWAGAQAKGEPINTVLRLNQEAQFTDYLPPVGGRAQVVVLTRGEQSLTLAVTRARQTADDEITLVLHDITDEVNRRDLQAYFLANMSHEFRTPLAGLRVSIELLMENSGSLSREEMDELMDSVYVSTLSLQNLIDNLLESSRIEASHFSVRRQLMPLNIVLVEALRVTQPLLHRRQQPLALTQPLRLPPLSIDRVRIIQVLVNLLSNASKYSPFTAPIDVIVTCDAGAVRVAVADRGAGIPPEAQSQVFQRFVQLAPTGSDYGTGLGLSVVKAIVEGHNGSVGVESREGGGSIFWFTLPLGEGNS